MVHEKFTLESIKIHGWLLTEQGLDQVEISAGENARPSTREVGKSHGIIHNTIVSVVVQCLIDHRFFDTEDPFDVLHFEALYILEIQDAVLEVVRDRAMRICNDERGRRQSASLLECSIYSELAVGLVSGSCQLCNNITFFKISRFHIALKIAVKPSKYILQRRYLTNIH